MSHLEGVAAAALSELHFLYLLGNLKYADVRKFNESTDALMEVITT